MVLFLLACNSSVSLPSSGEQPAEPAPTFHTGDTGDIVPDAGCTVVEQEVDCAYSTLRLQVGLSRRDVHYALPAGDPPAAGWPVVILYQGSFVSAERYFHGREGQLFGQLHQARLVDQLLQAGFAVLAPEAHLDGGLFWDTNVPPFSYFWSGSPDDRFVTRIFEAIDEGGFGPLDADTLFAAGISSGGYMTSRMALSYPGRFRALAIQSASWATCSGSLCVLPGALPVDHPPTLFLHGRDDLTVPVSTMRRYRERLDEDGVSTRMRIDEHTGHAWFETGPEEVTAWFAEHVP